MMVSPVLGFHRKVRIWINELPPAKYEIFQTIRCILRAERTMKIERTCAAIELLVPRGGRIEYGLLGAEFAANRSNEVTIEVGISDPAPPPYCDSLAASVDQVRLGLTVDFAQSVVEGATCAQEKFECLPSGVLLFNCAAHGAVGSNRFIFRGLGAAAVRLVGFGGETVPEGQLMSLFDFLL